MHTGGYDPALERAQHAHRGDHDAAHHGLHALAQKHLAPEDQAQPLWQGSRQTHKEHITFLPQHVIPLVFHQLIFGCLDLVVDLHRRLEVGLAHDQR
ncbi:hypothetical protein SDC9_116814 [bioreactor metagenome]|uniref:Uncharacterized protein n=1 Tax=bioreactor metagenome TaxID=1076179 RepID=A0A645BWG4_9ZZZZ